MNQHTLCIQLVKCIPTKMPTLVYKKNSKTSIGNLSRHYTPRKPCTNHQNGCILYNMHKMTFVKNEDTEKYPKTPLNKLSKIIKQWQYIYHWAHSVSSQQR